MGILNHILQIVDHITASKRAKLARPPLPLLGVVKLDSKRT